MAEHLQACPEWQDDLAAWLVAQGTPEREAALEAHVASCPTCRDEAHSLLGVAAVALAADPIREQSLPASGSDALPARLGARVATGILRERRRRTRRSALLVAVGGAAAAAVLVAALVAGSDDDVDPLRGDRFAFTIGSAEAVVAPDDGGSVVQIVARDLDPDVTYALWLSVPGGRWDDRVPAGTFRPGDDGTVDVRLRSAMPAEDVGRVWATTENGIALDTE